MSNLIDCHLSRALEATKTKLFDQLLLTLKNVRYDCIAQSQFFRRKCFFLKTIDFHTAVKRKTSIAFENLYFFLYKHRESPARLEVRIFPGLQILS